MADEERGHKKGRSIESSGLYRLKKPESFLGPVCVPEYQGATISSVFVDEIVECEGFFNHLRQGGRAGPLAQRLELRL